MRNPSVLRAAALVGVLAFAACKSPRPPHQAAEGDISGEWTAESVSTASPQQEGRVLWRLLINEQHGGRLEGAGSLTHQGGGASFTVNGIRGESVINFDLHMEDGGTATFDGSIMDMRTMVGQVALTHDTIPVTFTRP